MGNDIYMGGVRFTPDFDDMGAPQEQWYELSGGSGKGKVMIALAYQPSSVSSAFVHSAFVLYFCIMWFFVFLASALSHHWSLEVVISLSGDVRSPGTTFPPLRSPLRVLLFYDAPMCSFF